MRLEPVWTEGFLYCGIAMLNVLQVELRLLTPEKLQTLNWVDRFQLTISVLLAGMIALKTFRSESVARHRKDLKIEEAKELGDGTVTTEITAKQVETETIVTDKETPKERDESPLKKS